MGIYIIVYIFFNSYKSPLPIKPTGPKKRRLERSCAVELFFKDIDHKFLFTDFLGWFIPIDG